MGAVEMKLGSESETLEFKKSTSELKEACTSIAAMLNKHGLGAVYFGVKPDGTVIGQDISEATLRSISRTIAESIKPQIYPSITKQIIDGHTVAKVEVTGTDTPYSSRNRYYLRTADEDRLITPAALRKFFVRTLTNDSWESCDSGFPITKLDVPTFHRFLRDGRESGRLPKSPESDEQVLSRLGLTAGKNLNNAGNLLFGGSCPVTVKMAVFATPDKITFLDIKTTEGNIYKLLAESEKYIFSNIRWGAKITGSSRKEVPEIPVSAVREIIANSFAHADYQVKPAYHEICIYPDRITVFNPGNFANSHSPEQYIKDALPSLPRNLIIAKILYLGRKIEQFGSGFKRIASLCDDANVPYQFTNYDVGFLATLVRPSDNNVTRDIGVDVTLNATEMAVLTLLSQNPRQTRRELAEQISKTTRTIQRALNALTAKGYIRRKGNKSDPEWIVL